jgi:hypothetical protein
MTWLRTKLFSCASDAFRGWLGLLVGLAWAKLLLGHSEMRKDFVFLKKDLFIRESPSNHASLGIT